MSITSKDIKAGAADLEHKLSPQLNDNLTRAQRRDLFDNLIKELTAKSPQRRTSVADSFCIGYLSHQSAKLTEDEAERHIRWETALTHYEQVAEKWITGEPAFYARYAAGNIAQNLDYSWPKVEEKLLSAFQTLPTRGEPILRIVHYYQSKQQWPIAYLFSKFAKEQFHGKMPTAGNWGLDKSLYSWKALDVHKVSCYYLKKIDEATAAYSTLYRLITENPDSFLADDINRIVRQKFLFPGFANYEKNRTQYHLQ